MKPQALFYLYKIQLSVYSCTQIQGRQTHIAVSFNWIPVSKELSIVFLLYANSVTGSGEISTLMNVSPFILVVNSEPFWPSGKALGWFDTASALLSLQKGVWTPSCDFVHHFLLKH